MRGAAEDVTVEGWFNDRVWPMESNLTAEDLRAGALLACAEMIRSGVTTFADHYFFPDPIAEAVAGTGLRADIAPTYFSSGGAAALEAGVAFAEAWHGGADGRVTVSLGPHAPYTVEDRDLRTLADHARRLGVRMHIHAAEHLEQTRSSLERRGITPIRVLHDTGVRHRPHPPAVRLHPARPGRPPPHGHLGLLLRPGRHRDTAPRGPPHRRRRTGAGRRDEPPRHPHRPQGRQPDRRHRQVEGPLGAPGQQSRRQRHRRHHPLRDPRRGVGPREPRRRRAARGDLGARTGRRADRVDEPRRRTGRPRPRLLHGRRGARRDHLRRGLRRAALRRVPGVGGPHRSADRADPGGTVRRLRDPRAHPDAGCLQGPDLLLLPQRPGRRPHRPVVDRTRRRDPGPRRHLPGDRQHLPCGGRRRLHHLRRGHAHRRRRRRHHRPHRLPHRAEPRRPAGAPTGSPSCPDVRAHVVAARPAAATTWGKCLSAPRSFAVRWASITDTHDEATPPCS
ncbi:amidohydrolase family protein [Streptomyces caniscabiei]|nr:amidohydrolase family protein [Streptomyces caniscabiei]MDX3513864.1 amidohydrolase family protein [Streptomyces caniscabiei]MDX3722866.1 amidohydrolase family protein [Streptomyces caniscabiei]WEO29889.1 amidohydrolase family protein [Streptomyces caniscabiei]